jgi:1,4-dihydroxy-2-naphthoate octaprenyltransferase
VTIFQGALVFWLVYHGADLLFSTAAPSTGLLVSSLLIGGFYPLTQIYQHEQDRRDGVVSISALLGYKGTFVFTGCIYVLALAVMAKHYQLKMEFKQFLVVAILMTPIVVYYFIWANKVFRDLSAADYKHTMRMNLIACLCTNLAFLMLLILKTLE